MKYIIPRFNLPKLKSIVNRLSKKTEVKFSCDEEHPIQARVLVGDGVYSYYWEVEVDLEIDYKVGDYQLVAELEHTDNGNIIRQINMDYIVPKYYRTCKPICEHCNKLRNRTNTFLLLDNNTHNYRQVGSNCLNDYTGWDSLKVAEMCSSIALLLSTPPEEDEDFLEDLKNFKWYDLKETANKFYQLLITKGYDKEDPFDGLEDLIYDKFYDKEVDKLLDVINTDWYNDDSDYCHNVKVMLNLEAIETKHFRILMSYLNSAMLYLSNKDVKSDYLGNVGDKITFKCKNVKILWAKYNKWESTWIKDVYDYTYRIITDEGYVVIWTTGKPINPGDKIKATIKSLDMYKEEKQTVITRGSVL